MTYQNPRLSLCPARDRAYGLAQPLHRKEAVANCGWQQFRCELEIAVALRHDDIMQRLPTSDYAPAQSPPLKELTG